MSTQKWESVTWEWLEREIVDCLLIAGQQQENRRSGSLVRLLARQPEVRASSAISQRRRTQERANG
jgi:hypothetical protein